MWRPRNDLQQLGACLWLHHTTKRLFRHDSAPTNASFFPGVLFVVVV
jgi:hypothetical protein